MTKGTCYERVEMKDGVVRLCLCTWERAKGGELRITGVVRLAAPELHPDVTI